MFTNRLSFDSIKFIALAAAMGGCLIASSAQAVIVTEAHACNADSDTGGSWAGAYYFPGTRSARTYQYDVLSEELNLSVTLYAYPEGGYTYTQVSGYANSPVGVWYNEADALVTDPATAPGSLLSYHMAWTPTVTRASAGYFISSGEAVGDNGCKNRVSYL